MQINLNVVVDLGEFGSTGEQIADVATLARAVRDAVVWHGAITRLDVYDRRTGSLLLDADILVQPGGQQALAGVEWGGR